MTSVLSRDTYNHYRTSQPRVAVDVAKPRTLARRFSSMDGEPSTRIRYHLLQRGGGARKNQKMTSRTGQFPQGRQGFPKAAGHAAQVWQQTGLPSMHETRPVHSPPQRREELAVRAPGHQTNRRDHLSGAPVTTSGHRSAKRCHNR